MLMTVRLFVAVAMLLVSVVVAERMLLVSVAVRTFQFVFQPAFQFVPTANPRRRKCGHPSRGRADTNQSHHRTSPSRVLASSMRVPARTMRVPARTMDVAVASRPQQGRTDGGQQYPADQPQPGIDLLGGRQGRRR